MADVKWIKITTDMFDNKKIRHLRKLPDGNSIVLIWVMLLTMAGKCNANGMIYLTESIPYTPKMLADELGFEESTVVLALEALAQLNMISFEGDFFSISGWQEHQNIDGMDKIREQNRIRKQNQRTRQKLLTDGKCHVTSRDSHATDIDIDKDIKETLPIGSVKKSAERFTPPTVNEVEEYARQAGLCVDANDFWDFYQSKGWKVGKEHVVDWRAALRRWARKDTGRRSQGGLGGDAGRSQGGLGRQYSTNKPNRFHNYQQRNEDYDALINERDPLKKEKD